MNIGYARVSTQDQNLSLQLDALKSAGCDKIYQEKASGAKADRPELTRLLEHVREGDTIVIWKLDRLGRSLPNLVELVTSLQARGVGLVTLNGPIDTTTAQGKFTFQIFAVLAEYERELIRERTKAGLASARRQGKKLGRKEGLSEEAEKTARVAESMYRENVYSVQEIAKRLTISKTTLYKYLKHRGINIGNDVFRILDSGAVQ
ncbi:recombinase family protein [Spirosoma sp. BT702]|uniref:Recombinase family protein n=1 Tax=Spirosoma profusum TaxID=2771354 RepID=A0A926XY38_9BACT|nr:recombinase family protein [Spirosoma profusum]MBD2700172.1 recombinase family protein [Spirosoma profusum]